MLSVHTSPLHQPGIGDAGGLNVYVVELSKRLAALNVEVEIFTRAASRGLPARVELADGVLVRHVTAGPYEGLRKEDLPSQLCAFTSGVLRVEATREPGYYDLVHSHYWLSGQVGWLAKERWGVPLVHSMHTLAKVKNAALAGGDAPEPTGRLIGESQVVEAADMLVANTDAEAGQLVTLYGADTDRLSVVNPGVDLRVFAPGSRVAARRRLDLPADAVVLLFVGRVQPLKAPDILLRAAARMIERDPSLRDRLVVVVVGGLSGAGLAEPEQLHRLAAQLGIADVVRFRPPVAQHRLADYYRAATATVVPSHNESFGLVAVESQACGTPVVASAVGGLSTAVSHERSGLLVQGHDPADYAAALSSLTGPSGRAERMSSAAIAHAANFGWSATAARMLEVYARTLAASAPCDRLAAGQ